MGQGGRGATRRGWWLAAFSLLLLCLGAIPAFADPVGPVEGDFGSRVEAAALPTAADLARAEEALEEQEEARKRELRSAGAIAEREASRLAYRDVDSAGEAADLLRSRFPEELETLKADPARFLSDVGLKLDFAEGAVVINDGQPELMEAAMPARVRSADGDLAKVDLVLEDTADGFRTKNPIGEIEIGSSADEGVSLDGGEVTIRQAGASPRSDGRLFGDKDVLYPDVQTDTDLLVAPLSTGVELFNQLRSVESPETLRFELGLPAGALLRANGNGAEVLEGERVIATVLAPYAVDAQGTSVPVSMQVDGHSLVLDVPHREGDYAYPILVDPDVQNNWVSNSWYAGNNYHVLEDDTFIDWNNNPGLRAEKWCIYACWGSGRGLFVSFPSNGYASNQQVQWAYFVKGETTYLTGYLINPFYRDNHGCSPSQYSEPHDFDGIWSPKYNIYYQLYTNRAQYTNASVYGNTAQSVKAMVFGMNSGGGLYIPCWRDIYAGGVATYMSDPENPTLDPLSGQPSGWFDDSKTYGVNVSAHDPGLGVRNIQLNPPNTAEITLKASDCHGTHDSPCPRDMSGKMSFNGDSFWEGKNVTNVVANDALLRSSNTRTWTAYVDNTPPEVSLSGQLAVATEEDEGDAKDPEKWDELSLPVYKLDIDATDGKAGNDLTMRSGVKDIEVFIDGKEEEESVPWEAQGCSGPSYSCSMSVTYTLELAGLDSGKHTLEVVAIDQLNHKREREIEFEYIPATGIKDAYVMQHFPLPDGQGGEEGEEGESGPELAVNVVNGNLVYRQRDVDVEGPAVDLEVERFYNSQQTPSEDTEWGDGWTLAQAPRMELDAKEEAPEETAMLRRSGILNGSVELPTETEEELFDPELQATITKEPSGGYEVADESGETESALAFDKAGKVQELRSGGYADVDYDYEEGKLTAIAVDDPGSTADTSGVAEAPFPEGEGEGEEAEAPEGLVAAYSFDEGSGGVVYDDTGNGHDGEVFAVDWTAAGKHGGALDFNAKFDQVSIPDADDLDLTGAFTLEAWVRPHSDRELGLILCKCNEGWESDYLLFATEEEGGPPVAYIADEEGRAAGSEALPEETWSHLAASFDGEELRLYVNGEEVASEPAPVPVANDGELKIGGDWNRWEFFDGVIDDVRIYDRMLGGEEIEVDMNTAVESTRGLVAAYPFEDGLGEEAVHDYTGDHDGTVDGAEWTPEGKYGGAFSFDGKDDLVTIPGSEDLAFSDDFTVEAWVRPEENSDRASVVAKEAPSSLSYQLLAKKQENNRPAGYIFGQESEASAQGSSGLPLGSWSHIAMTSDGAYLRFYVNGKLTQTSNAIQPAAGEGPLQIGGDLLAEEDFFNGRIDEVRIYNRVLSAGQLTDDKEAPIVDPPTEPVPVEDDPAVDIALESGLVSSVEGEEAGETDYEHEGDLLTAVDGPEGETAYDYDEEGRMTKVTLPNGTWGSIAYREDGRVKSVTVKPAEGEEKTTFFTYSDEPRRTTVTPEGEPAVRYDIGADGSVLRWQNVQKPPIFDNLGGSIYFNKDKELPSGAQVLDVIAHSEEGIASIQVLTSGTDLVDEATCEEDLETEEVECKTVESEWVMETENFAPGRLDIEVIAEDRLGEMAAERFWVNIPQSPPPSNEAPSRPKFSEIEQFRDEFGLDIVDPVNSEKERNARIFNLMHAWSEGDSVARASAERWGVPLRQQDVAELEYREWFYDINTDRIDQWVEETEPSSFGGYYMDHAAGGIMHIGFLDNQAEQLASLKASLSLVGGERLQMYPVAPTDSYLSVRATTQSALGAIESNPTLADLVVSVDDDEAGKATRVGTPHVAQVEGILDQMLGANAPVTVEYEAGGGALLEGRYRNEGRMRAGDYINSDLYAFEGIPTGGRCTAGFGAEDRRPSVNGGEIVRLFLLTAGHCAVKIDEEVWRAPQDESQGFADAGKSEVGRIARSALQYYELGGVRTDGAAIRIKQGGIIPQAIWGWGGHALPTKPAGKAKIGNVLCYSGAISKNVSCGKVVARSLNHRGTGGEAPFGLAGYWVRFPEGRRPVKGDSGSPVWNLRTGASIGLVSAGRPKDSFEETLVAPLLHPPNMPANRVPGILHHLGMAPLRLRLGG